MILGLTERILILDTETSSPVPLKTRGMANYWAHPETRVLMTGYKYLGDAAPGPVVDHEIRKDYRLPPMVEASVRAPKETCMLAAANFEFDRAALQRMGYPTPRDKWIDVLVLAYILGFSGRLDDVLQQAPIDARKNPRGSQCIAKFSVRGVPWHEDPGLWEEFLEYCRNDADVEEKLLAWTLEHLDTPWMRKCTSIVLRQEEIYRRINARGLPIALDDVRGALKIRDDETDSLLARMRGLTGLENPNSRDQLLEWCRAQGSPIGDLRKDTVRDERDRLNALTKRTEEETVLSAVLGLRQELGKTSVKKYDALASATGPDGCLRHVWQYYGASRTGRVAGRVLNPANLPRPSIDDPDLAVSTLRHGRRDLMKAHFPDEPVMDVLSSCIRGMVKAPPGRKLCVADLTSIESVGAAWLAGCDAILDIFHQGRDTYRTFAAKAEGIPYEDVTKEQRTFYKPCLAGNTLVLTDRGWVPLILVRIDDHLWDGEGWVEHQGVLYRGMKPSILRHGVRATPDHRFLDRGEWIEFHDLEDRYFERDNGSVYGASSSTTTTTTTATKDTCANARNATSGKRPRRTFSTWNGASRNENTVVVPVYDLIDAGPARRFTIKTAHGTAVASNCVLGGAYGLSGEGLTRYAAAMGVQLDRTAAAGQIKAFRDEYHELRHIQKLYMDCAIAAVRNPDRVYEAHACDRVTATAVWKGNRIREYSYRESPVVKFWKHGDFLYVKLPSGRILCYFKPDAREHTVKLPDGSSFETVSLFYWGTDQKATSNRWTEISTHGGGLLENFTQALCRDVLWHALELVDADPRFELIMDIYDEIGTVVDEDFDDALPTLLGYMTSPAPWLDERFFLGAEGYVSDRFKKG